MQSDSQQPFNTFPTDWPSIEQRIRNFDPQQYAISRNYLNGAVSLLSPYLSRGVISPVKVLNIILEKYTPAQAAKFIQELAWREYFQRIWQEKGNRIFTDLRHSPYKRNGPGIPDAVYKAKTGIHALDQGIEQLYLTGYLHNHIRMYLASICCNIAGSPWQEGARWMYYHLLDGDPASNYLSWQWVAGSFSSKPYFMNQDNVNQYTKIEQRGTYLDHPYERLYNLPVPEALQARIQFEASTSLPASESLPSHANTVLLYNSFNLDPHWHSACDAVRILLLEPDHFQQFPVSSRVMNFILALAKQIKGLIIYCGRVEELQQQYPGARFIFKNHPTTGHYPGMGEAVEWMFPARTGYFPSFSAYWKPITKGRKSKP